MCTLKRPVFLKIAPDLSDEELDDIAAEATEQKLDGIIVSNTTLSRAGLKSTENREETGGLSGAPLLSVRPLFWPVCANASALTCL